MWRGLPCFRYWPGRYPYGCVSALTTNWTMTAAKQAGGSGGKVKSLILLFVLALPLLMSCAEPQSIWHDQMLPSGKTIKITSFHLVWGVEHDARYPGNDNFALEFVSANPQAGPKAQEQEAWEVFELIRPISEQWGFTTASLSGYPSTRRKGAYNVFVFKRSSAGKWSCTRYPAKVFAND